MNQRRWNWQLWAGFVICLIAFASYPVFFAKFPLTRDVPWVNYLLFGAGIALLLFGLKRAFSKPEQYRGKIAGPILGLLSLAAVGFFAYLIFFMTRQLPASVGASRVRADGPRVRAARREQPTGFPRQLALHAAAELADGPQGSAAHLLSRLLVTVLQLRVTGY